MDLEVKVRFSQMGWEAPGCRWFTGLRVHTVLAQCPVPSAQRAQMLERADGQHTAAGAQVAGQLERMDPLYCADRGLAGSHGGVAHSVLSSPT